MSDNFFTDPKRFRQIDGNRILYFFTFLVSFALTEFGRFVYRPFIYTNGINDFGIADSIGNSGGIVVQFFFGLIIFNSPKKKGYRLLLFFVLGYVLYEFAQIYLPKSTFDWHDIYATIIGGIIALFFYSLIHLFYTNKVYRTL